MGVWFSVDLIAQVRGTPSGPNGEELESRGIQGHGYAEEGISDDRIIR